MSQETIVIFRILDFNEKLLIKQLRLKNVNLKVNVDKESLKIKIKNFPKNVDDYYIEKLELLSDNAIKRYFRIKIYKNRINYRDILLNELNNFSFEISYFNRNQTNLPEKLNIKIKNSNYELQQMCKTDLPFIKSFSIINCDKTITIDNKHEIHLEEDESGSFNANFIASNENYLMKITKIYKNYYPKLIKHDSLNGILNTYINNIKNKLKEKNIKKSEFSEFLRAQINSWQNVYLEDADYYITNRLYPLEEDDYSLLLNYITYLIFIKVNQHTESYPILNCFFDLINKLKKKMNEKMINQRDILSFSYYFYKNYCSVKSYKNSLHNNNKESYINLYDSMSINWLDFDIVFIKEIKNGCSYKKAIKLLENVLDNLNENSKLLEILYFLNSGTGRIINNENNYGPKTSFNLSMISKDNIINHVKSLIPNMIIRKNKPTNKNSDPYAECEILSGMITIYEETLFKINLSETKKFLIDEDDIDDSYTLSIYLCLLHELCSHLKLVIKDKTMKSPNIINDPYDNYKDLELEMEESGRTMEYYISNDINKIKFLKFSFTPKSELNDPKLWIDKNFEKLNLLIEQLMDKTASYEYLNNNIYYFPKVKTNIIEENKIENKNQIMNDWKESSPENSDDEKIFRNKQDIKNKTFKTKEKIEKPEIKNYPRNKYWKPIFKY